MNFLKKKLKPLATSLTGASTANTTKSSNLEDDLYDEYVVEAPPHPSELIALGIDPSQIDINDPDKLRELYRKAKESGKDKQTNSILLAKQRQKEEIEEKKRTREEWKFFDNLTLRVEQVVKDSQKTLEQLKDRSAVNKLAEPDYELRQTADEVFKPVTGVKVEKIGESDWVAFGGGASSTKGQAEAREQRVVEGRAPDEFGLGERKRSLAPGKQLSSSSLVASELLEDLGIDLRSEEQRRSEEAKRRAQELAQKCSEQQRCEEAQTPAKQQVAAHRPRPRPGASSQATATAAAISSEPASEKGAPEVDPFDTSFLAEEILVGEQQQQLEQVVEKRAEPVDPFDTSYVELS